MTDYETIHRLRCVVDNSERRQIPLPTPWYERFAWLGCLALAALFGAYAVAVLMLSVGP